MQLSTLAPALRGQQFMQPQTQNNAPTAATLPSATKDAFHNTSPQKAPKFGCFGWCRDINARDAEGSTALLRALINGKTNKVRKLVNKGADVSISDNKGDFPLKLAARHNNVEAARALLSAPGANINQQDQQGDTALITATTNGRVEMVELLLERHADRTIRNNTGTQGAFSSRHGDTALQIATRRLGEAKNQTQDPSLTDRYTRIIQLLTPPGEGAPLVPVPGSYKGQLSIKPDGSAVFKF